VVEHLGLFLGQHHHTTGTVGKSLKHLRAPHATPTQDAEPL